MDFFYIFDFIVQLYKCKKAAIQWQSFCLNIFQFKYFIYNIYQPEKYYFTLPFE